MFDNLTLGEILFFAASCQVGADDAHFHGGQFLLYMGLVQHSSRLDLLGVLTELLFIRSTEGTLPVGRKILPPATGSFVINIAANTANILLHRVHRLL